MTDVVVDLTVAPANVESTYRRQVCDVTLPDSYQTGGYGLNPEDVRMGKIFAVLFSVTGTAVGGVGYLPTYDQETGAIIMYRADTGAEASPGVAFDDVVLRVEVVGQ